MRPPGGMPTRRWVRPFLVMCGAAAKETSPNQRKEEKRMETRKPQPNGFTKQKPKSLRRILSPEMNVKKGSPKEDPLNDSKEPKWRRTRHSVKKEKKNKHK